MANLTNDQVRELRSRYETEPDGAGDDEVVQACDDLIESRAETAAARAMLKEHHGRPPYGYHGRFDPLEPPRCQECEAEIGVEPCKPDCAWAAAMGEPT